MFSLKPLALYFLFGFGILSTFAIPRDAPRANADDDTLLDIIQALNTSLAGPLEQLGSLTPSTANPQTVGPIVDTMHSSFNVAVQQLATCTGNCTGGGLGDVLSAVGSLVNEVLQVVATVIDVVDGIVGVLGPFLLDIGDDLENIVNSLTGATGSSDVVTNSLASSLSGDTDTMKIMAPGLLNLLGL
ncbi:hypothetical protein EIP86_006778 [Pleurotus ostreatoroseus]|nr:hypothetical protein EIP86_006778 [Pleurotus ostreatoroseus]